MKNRNPTTVEFASSARQTLDQLSILTWLYESSHDFSNKNYWIRCRTLWAWWFTIHGLEDPSAVVVGRGLDFEWFRMRFVTIEIVTRNWHPKRSLIEPRPGLRRALHQALCRTSEKKKRGRPSGTDSADVSSASKRCSRDAPFDKEKCVICQDYTGAELHEVSTKNMGLQMRNIGLETSNDSLKVRLSSVTCSTDPLQAVADDMKYQFETILHFIRGTRQRDLQLHLESIQSLMKYFFAHDHLNYAKLLPLYISTMQETEKRHPSLWREFTRGHFCVTKGLAGFTSTASDHGIEQENRKLKVMGGIVGLTQNEKALDKFFS